MPPDDGSRPALMVADRCLQVPAIIDFEASGFGGNGYPIEVGYILGDGRRYCTLIEPIPSWTHWDAGAAAVHRIARAALFTHGRKIPEVCARLDADLGGDVVYSDAWSFDYTWLHTLYAAIGRRPTFRVESLRKLLSESDAENWHAAREAACAEMQGARHRASVDATAIQRAYCMLKGLRPPAL